MLIQLCATGLTGSKRGTGTAAPRPAEVGDTLCSISSTCPGNGRTAQALPDGSLSKLVYLLVSRVRLLAESKVRSVEIEPDILLL